MPFVPKNQLPDLVGHGFELNLFGESDISYFRFLHNQKGIFKPKSVRSEKATANALGTVEGIGKLQCRQTQHVALGSEAYHSKVAKKWRRCHFGNLAQSAVDQVFKLVHRVGIEPTTQ
jgi:hypothetical protein